MSNQITQALNSGERAWTPNSPGGHDIISPDVARAHEIDEADHKLDAWRNAFDPQPIAATAMSTQVEAHPHATTTDTQFNNIMNNNVQNGVFDPGYIDAISGNQIGATMPADTPRPASVEAQQNFQQYQEV